MVMMCDGGQWRWSDNVKEIPLSVVLVCASERFFNYHVGRGVVVSGWNTHAPNGLACV